MSVERYMWPEMAAREPVEARQAASATKARSWLAAVAVGALTLVVGGWVVMQLVLAVIL